MVQFNSERLAEICRQHGVARLRIFGSTARGEDTPTSDADLITDFSVPKGFFGVIELEEVLSEASQAVGSVMAINVLALAVFS